MKQYRVVLTLKAPFNDPVEMPYGPAQPSKFKALAALTNAMDTHLDDDRWTSVQCIRIDVDEVTEACWCLDPATYRVPVDPEISNPNTTMSDGEPGLLVCEKHMDKDGYEAL